MNRLLVLIVLFFIILTTTIAHAALKVVMVDVGMGQSMLLVEKNHGILIDTGLASYGDHVIQRMKSHGIDKLDYILLSHLHPDHAGGYPQIRTAWPDTPVFHDCHIAPSLDPSEEDFFTHTQQQLLNDPLSHCLKAGDNLSWQRHTLAILWPEELQTAIDLNKHSLVILLTTKEGETVLIMGDVNKDVERHLITVLRPLLKHSAVNLYVASHHGAIDTGVPEFLQMLRPEISLIAVGEKNENGYPATETVQLLTKYSGTLLRTDKNGEICFQTDSGMFIPCKRSE
jgi:competence protein ComEC